MRTERRPPQQRERAEQQQIRTLLMSLGAKVYVLGTTRRRSDSHFGTMQTPGLPDLIAFMPRPRWGVCDPLFERQLLIVECKASGGRLRIEQAEFRDLSIAANVAHVVGGVDAVIAWLIAHAYLKPGQVAHYRTEPEAT